MATAEAPNMGMIRRAVTIQDELGGILPPCLTPVDCVAQKLTAVADEFTRREQVFVLKAHGLKSLDIGIYLGISPKTVEAHEYLATAGYRSSIEVIISLADSRTIPLLIEGLVPGLDGRLSPRELDVLKKVSTPETWAMGNRELAESIGIAEGTLETHLTRIYNKLGARNRVQAVIYRSFMPESAITD